MTPWSGPEVGEGARPASLCTEYGLLLGADVAISSASSCRRPTLPVAGGQGLGPKGVGWGWLHHSLYYKALKWGILT